MQQQLSFLIAREFGLNINVGIMGIQIQYGRGADDCFMCNG